jgi:hypothetical protein
MVNENNLFNEEEKEKEKELIFLSFYLFVKLNNQC